MLFVGGCSKQSQHVCGISLQQEVSGEGVHNARTINRVPLNHGATTVTSSISPKALERGTIDQRRTWEYGDRGKGVCLYRDLSSSSSSCCCHRAMRHSNGARDAPISSLIVCKATRHMRIPLHKRASVAAMERERWGDSRGHEPHESSTEERRPTIDVCKSARKSISSDSAPPIVWFAIRRRQGLRDTNTEPDRA